MVFDLIYRLWDENNGFMSDRDSESEMEFVIRYSYPWVSPISVRVNGVLFDLSSMGSDSVNSIIEFIESLEIKGYSRDYTIDESWGDNPEADYFRNVFESFKDTFPFESMEIKGVDRLCSEITSGYIEFIDETEE